MVSCKETAACSSGVDECQKESSKVNAFGPIAYASLAISVVFLALLYSPVFKHWWVQWNAKESYYSHGILIPFISAFIIWLDRKNLSSIAVMPSASAYFLLIPVLAMGVFSIWVPSVSIAGAFFPVILYGIGALLLGWKMVRRLSFPLAYLYFAVPLPAFVLTVMSFRIRMLSTIGAFGMLKALSLHVSRIGTDIFLPNGVTVSVESPCSGFRFLISLFALAVLVSHLVDGEWWRKALLVVLMLPLSALLNGFRIMLVALVGNFWGADAMIVFHDNYAGLIMTAMGIACLYLLTRVLRCQRFNTTLSF